MGHTHIYSLNGFIEPRHYSNLVDIELIGMLLLANVTTDHTYRPWRKKKIGEY